MFTVSIASVLLSVALLKLWTHKQTEKIKFNKFFISPETVELTHYGVYSKNLVNVELLKNKYKNTQNDRIEENIKFMEIEKKLHKGSQSETILCLKNCLYPSIYKTVYEDNNPGIVRRILPCVEIISERLEADNLKWLRWLVVKARRISTIYIDLFKDLYLAVLIFVLIGGIQALTLFPTKMTSVVVICLLTSVFVPMLLSSIILAMDKIGQSKVNLKLTQKFWMFFKCLLLSPINPLLLMNNVENLKEELMTVCRRDTITEAANNQKIIDIQEAIYLLEQQNAAFIKTEIQLETFQQMTLQFLLMFLSLTTTPTTGGLEEMFKKTDPVLLCISICWSFLSVSSKIIKFMSLEKAFFPMISRIVIALFAFFATLTGILVNVIFFTPSLGLFNILGHWQAEQLPFTVATLPTERRAPSGSSSSLYETRKRLLTKMLNGSNGDMLQIFNHTPIPWSMIDRWSEGKPPSYTLYTIFDLRTFFILFLLIKLMQTVIIFIVKRVTSPTFKKAELIKQIIHALENTSISVPFKDWDVESGTIKKHMQRLHEVVREGIITFVINKLIGFMMIMPLICTGIHTKTNFYFKQNFQFTRLMRDMNS